MTKINTRVSPNGTLVLSVDGRVPAVFMALRLHGPCCATVYELFMNYDVLPCETWLKLKHARDLHVLTCITPSVMLDTLRSVDPSFALSAGELLAMTKCTPTSTYLAEKVELCSEK